MKKETLEEAAKNNYPEADVWNLEQAVIRRLAFMNGAKWQQEQMYSKQSIFDITSYKLLAEQKAVLIQLINKEITKAEQDALAGIINFLDTFQDEAVDVHGKSEREVFSYIESEDE